MNPNQPAFPPPAYIDDRGNWNNPSSCGMSIRLYIATHALQGLLDSGWTVTHDEMATEALKLADALIEQEKKH